MLCLYLFIYALYNSLVSSSGAHFENFTTDLSTKMNILPPESTKNVSVELPNAAISSGPLPLHTMVTSTMKATVSSTTDISVSSAINPISSSATNPISSSATNPTASSATNPTTFAMTKDTATEAIAITVNILNATSFINSMSKVSTHFDRGFLTEATQQPNSVFKDSPDVCNTTLDETPSLSAFWLQTALISVSLTTNVSACNWRGKISARLLDLLRLAAAHASNATWQVQLVSSRVSSTRRVILVYYALRNGVLASASSVASELNAIGDRASAVLGYQVALPVATVYEASTPMELPWLLLAMAAACTLLATAIMATAAVLTLYFGCLRPRGGHRRLRLPSSAGAAAFDKEEEVYLDPGSLRPVAHMRANPKISYSSAGIDAIADQVTRHLEEHMSELMLGWQLPVAVTADSNTRPSRQSPIGEGCDVDDNPSASAEVQLRCPQTTSAPPLAEPADGRAGTNGKDRSRDADNGNRIHSAIERQRNKERLRSMLQDSAERPLRQNCLEAQPPTSSPPTSGGDSSAREPLLIGDKCFQQSGDSNDGPSMPSVPRVHPRKPRLGLRAAAAAAESAARRMSVTAAAAAVDTDAERQLNLHSASSRRVESMLDEKFSDLLTTSSADKASGSKSDRKACLATDQSACVPPFLKTTQSCVAHL